MHELLEDNVHEDKVLEMRRRSDNDIDIQI